MTSDEMYEALLNHDDLESFKLDMQTSPIPFTELSSEQCIKLSIRKWELIVNKMVEREQSGDYFIPSDGGTSTCALCRKCMRRGSSSIHPCGKCPISIRAHAQYCERTPYTDFIQLRERIHLDYGRASAGEYKEAIAFAEEEVDFLRSLLNEDDNDDD